MSTGGNALIDNSTGFVLSTQLPTTLPSTMNILSSTTGIDLTAAATTTLYTPSGFSGIIVGIMVRTTSGSGFVTAASVSVGENGGVNDIIPITALTGLNAANLYFPVFVQTVATITPSGTAIKFKVTTPAVATGLVASVDLVGYLI